MFSIFRKKTTLKDIIPKDFVDIHCHLLPKIDDGATDLDNTWQLIDALQNIGFAKCIVTPHTLKGVWNNSSENIKQNFLETKANLQSIQSDYINSFSSEYMLDYHFIKLLQQNDVLPLKDNFLLVEMSYKNLPMNLYDILFEITKHNYQPILAHPERYGFYHHKLEEYKKLKQNNVKFQLNLLSTVGYYGASIAKIVDKLLENNYIDFTGSDVHHFNHIQAFDLPLKIKNIDQLQHAMENTIRTFS